MDNFAQQKLYMELQEDRQLILACSTRRNNLVSSGYKIRIYEVYEKCRYFLLPR